MKNTDTIFIGDRVSKYGWQNVSVPFTVDRTPTRNEFPVRKYAAIRLHFVQL